MKAISITNAQLAKLHKRRSQPDLEGQLWCQLKLAGIAGLFEKQFVFARPRRFRFDLAHPDLKLAFEVEGGSWIAGGGRHTRGSGFANDCEKYNLAALLNWRVFRFTGQMIRDGQAIQTIQRAIEAR